MGRQREPCSRCPVGTPAGLCPSPQRGGHRAPAPWPRSAARPPSSSPRPEGSSAAASCTPLARLIYRHRYRRAARGDLPTPSPGQCPPPPTPPAACSAPAATLLGAGETPAPGSAAAKPTPGRAPAALLRRSPSRDREQRGGLGGPDGIAWRRAPVLPACPSVGLPKGKKKIKERGEKKAPWMSNVLCERAGPAEELRARFGSAEGGRSRLEEVMTHAAVLLHLPRLSPRKCLRGGRREQPGWPAAGSSARPWGARRARHGAARHGSAQLAPAALRGARRREPGREPRRAASSRPRPGRSGSARGCRGGFVRPSRLCAPRCRGHTHGVRCFGSTFLGRREASHQPTRPQAKVRKGVLTETVTAPAKGTHTAPVK